MAREAVRNEPSVSCSLKERGLSTSLVAYLYVPLGVVAIRLFLCTSCTFFFFFFSRLLYWHKLYACHGCVCKTMVTNCHLLYAYLLLVVFFDGIKIV